MVLRTPPPLHYLFIKRKDFSDLFMKKLIKILKYILINILVFLAIICISVFIQTKVNPNKIPSIFGYKPFIVLSGSMETEIYVGDLVIVKSIDAFQRIIDLFDFLFCISCVHCMRPEKDIRRIVRLNKEVHKHLLPFFCI